jgi:hypothetical protein
VANIDDIDFVDATERTYFAQAQVGEQMHAFLRSPEGRYLHGCAKREVEMLRDELESLNVDGWFTFFGKRKLRRLQRKAEAARFFMTWCAEAIQEGKQAFNELETYRE